MKNVLIIGRLPPPIGGVSVHVGRLAAALTTIYDSNFSICDLNENGILSILFKILRHRVIHIHFSNPYSQLVFAVFCKIFSKKLIITYHGSWGRYNSAGNLAVKLSAFFATVPVVQNVESCKEAMRVNKASILLSTYIPKRDISPLPGDLSKTILLLKNSCRKLFCTNAWNVVFDRNSLETYGITSLVNRFAKFPALGLIISDPSGNYKHFLLEKFGDLPENVTVISGLHDFTAVLSLSDCFIRNTTTDGTSLSIFEAYESNIPVLASDCISRAGFCELFRDICEVDLEKALARAKMKMKCYRETETKGEDPVKKIVEVYNELLAVGGAKKTKA